MLHLIPELVGLSGKVTSTERLCWTYVLENTLGDVYIGMSFNPALRLIQHRKGQCASSRTGCDSWQRIAMYGFVTAEMAHRFELFLQALTVLELYEYLAHNPTSNTQVANDAASFVFKHELSIPSTRHSVRACASDARVGVVGDFTL